MGNKTGKEWKQWLTLFFWGSKITADDDCSHEIKRHLLFGRKAMTNLDNVLKSRDSTLLTNIHIVMVPGGASGKEPTCLCRRHKRHGFNPWVGKIPWRRAWQFTPVFLPGESHEPRSLAGCGPRGCKESDTTEVT